jgi:two-component system response regulator LytT
MLRILIIEDERPILNYIADLLEQVLDIAKNITKSQSLTDAKHLINEQEYDICFLDLNLHGENGFELLHEFMARSFHTVIVSAYAEKAIKAFEYGVLDFIEKPFDKERIAQTMNRYFNVTANNKTLKYLSYRHRDRYDILNTENVTYFKASASYCEAYVNDSFKLINKPIERLAQILSLNFFQNHRSYIVNLNFINSYYHEAAGVYKIKLKDGTILPLSRSRFQELKKLLSYK